MDNKREPHGPISTPDSFNNESERLRWKYRIERGRATDGSVEWRVVKRNGDLAYWTGDATAAVVWALEKARSG